MLAIKVSGIWHSWGGEPINDICYPPNIESAWSDKDLAAVGLFRVNYQTPPEGKTDAGNHRLEDQNGLPVMVQDWITARRLVSKSIIVDRLQLAGKLGDARAALDAAPLVLRERWNAISGVYADDADTIALLKAIGADPTVILA